MAPLSSFLASLALLVPFVAAAPFDFGIGTGGSGDSGVRFRISNADAHDIIPNRYIVVYNSTFDDDVIEAKQASVMAEVKKRNLGKRGLHGHLLSTEVHTYRMNKWRAMSLDADDLFINDIWNSEEVAYIEADAKVSLSAAVAQTNAPPGLIRLSNAKAGGSNYIFDSSSGEGITAYVVDTGIRTTHTDFQGRATFGGNFVDDVVCSWQKQGHELQFLTSYRTKTRMAMVATSLARSAVSLSVLRRRSTSWQSRSLMPMAVVATPVC